MSDSHTIAKLLRTAQQFEKLCADQSREISGLRAENDRLRAELARANVETRP